MRKLRVLVVDDSALFLGAARNVLSVLPEVACAEYVRSGADALAKLAAFCPDLMLVDVMMPGMSGFEVLRAVRDCAVVPVMYAITMHDSADFLAEAIKNGADGLIPKREFAEKIRELIADLASENAKPKVTNQPLSKNDVHTQQEQNNETD
ncbi:MAG: chemotaxis protein CheY [Betaproteobacteria bacterium]|nr:chemotaxis protein CheY [Betaproteobacteria bacterium]